MIVKRDSLPDQDVRLVFDAAEWAAAGYDQPDGNERFWHAARLVSTYRNQAGDRLATIQWERDGRLSFGHFIDAMRPVARKALNGGDHAIALPAEGESLSPRARLGDYKIEDRGFTTPCWIWQKRKDNPAHLEHVPPHINVHRGDQAKLTMDDAREIRRRIVAGDPMTPIAAEYGVSIHTIHWIAEDVMWREDYDAPRQPVRPEGVHCRECGELITTGKRNKKFCSPEHRERWNSRTGNRRRRGKNPDGSDTRSYVRAASRDSQHTETES